MKVLVIKLGAFGDIIQSIGSFESLAKKYSDIHLLTRKPFADICKEQNIFKSVTVDFGLRPWQLFQYLKQFSCIYDLQMVDRTALYSLFAPFAKWHGHLPWRIYDNNPKRHLERCIFRYAKLLGDAAKHTDFLQKNYPLRFELAKRFALLVPGASAEHYAQKAWAFKNYQDLAAYLWELGLQPVIISGEQFDFPEYCLNLCGKTIWQDLVALGQKATIAIGNDTGPMHLFAATNTPLIGLFCGKHNPEVVGAMGESFIHLQKENINNILFDEVQQAVSQLLSL